MKMEIILAPDNKLTLIETVITLFTKLTKTVENPMLTIVSTLLTLASYGRMMINGKKSHYTTLIKV